MADNDIERRLRGLGLLAAASDVDDLIAYVTKHRSSPQQILEHIAEIEEKDRARRSLERRAARSRLGRFKAIADFDWSWRHPHDDRQKHLLAADHRDEAARRRDVPVRDRGRGLDEQRAREHRRSSPKLAA